MTRAATWGGKSSRFHCSSLVAEKLFNSNTVLPALFVRLRAEHITSSNSLSWCSLYANKIGGTPLSLHKPGRARTHTCTTKALTIETGSQLLQTDGGNCRGCFPFFLCVYICVCESVRQSHRNHAQLYDLAYQRHNKVPGNRVFMVLIDLILNKTLKTVTRPRTPK